MARNKKATGPFIGKAPLTIVKNTLGTHAYVYAGQPVPTDVSELELQRLYDEEFIVEAPAPVVVVVETPPAPPARAPRKGAKETAAAPKEPTPAPVVTGVEVTAGQPNPAELAESTADTNSEQDSEENEDATPASAE